MNESAEGRDGYILALGRKLYHVYKQSFPMEFWYGLTPEANRECSGPQIDVRSLPEKYHHGALTVDWSHIPKRSMAKAMREQLNRHAITFASALHDGYSLEDHVAREEAAERAEFEARAAERAKLQADRKAIGVCTNCGAPSPDIDKWGECPPCADIPF